MLTFFRHQPELQHWSLHCRLVWRKICIQLLRLGRRIVWVSSLHSENTLNYRVYMENSFKFIRPEIGAGIFEHIKPCRGGDSLHNNGCFLYHVDKSGLNERNSFIENIQNAKLIFNDDATLVEHTINYQIKSKYCRIKLKGPKRVNRIGVKAR